MTKRSRVKLGDIVAIPLDKERFAVGIVLHISTIFKNAIMMGFYKALFKSAENIDIEKLGGEFIETPNYIGKQLITKGPWRVIGNSNRLLVEATIPQLRVAYTLYYKDQELKQLTDNELSKYVALKGQGGAFVENKLRKYFSDEMC